MYNIINNKEVKKDMKQAYLIIAHNKIEQLKFLVSLLDYEKHDIFIMFDKKSRVTKEEKRQVEDTVKKSNIFFTKEVPIYWGDYSLVEAELELFETALEKDEYSMYHLLSGVDLPLDTAENIYNFFDENQDYSFIDVPPKEIFDKVKANERIKYYYLDTKRINMRNTNSKIMKDMFTLYRKLEKKFQKIIRVNRIKNVSVSYGSNWCSLNRSSLNTIITKRVL